MKYMLLMQGTQGAMAEFGQMPMEDLKRHIDFMHALNEELVANGELLVAEGLAPPSQAKLVRAKPDGTAAVTDGPFAESKEFLAGFWILACDEARAIEIARRVSASPGRGGEPVRIDVEIRPVGEPPA